MCTYHRVYDFFVVVEYKNSIAFHFLEKFKLSVVLSADIDSTFTDLDLYLEPEVYYLYMFAI